MISIVDPTFENVTTAVAEKQTVNIMGPIVICGSCGAQELATEGNRTECPHCDEYIY